MGCVSRRLKHVAPQHDALAIVLRSDKAHWCFDRTDHKDLDTEVKAEPDNTQAYKEFQEKFTEKRKDMSLALANTNGQAKEGTQNACCGACPFASWSARPAECKGFHPSRIIHLEVHHVQWVVWACTAIHQKLLFRSALWPQGIICSQPQGHVDNVP